MFLSVTEPGMLCENIHIYYNNQEELPECEWKVRLQSSRTGPGSFICIQASELQQEVEQRSSPEAEL